MSETTDPRTGQIQIEATDRGPRIKHAPAEISLTCEYLAHLRARSVATWVVGTDEALTLRDAYGAEYVYDIGPANDHIVLLFLRGAA